MEILARAQELMLSDMVVVELFEEIQEAGGPVHEAICRMLGDVIDQPSGSPRHRLALDGVHELIQRQALRRAIREYCQEIPHATHH